MIAAFLLSHNLRLIHTVSTEFDLDWRVVAAISHVESKGNPAVFRFEPHYPYLVDVAGYAKKFNLDYKSEEAAQRFSYGLMQIMGGTARQMGFTGPLSDLFDPEINMQYACKYLKQLMARYPSAITDVAAAYNKGSVKKDDTGNYVNQEYVDKFLAAYSQLL